MAAVLTAVVRRAGLGPLELIGSGGFGDVYRVKRFSLPGRATALAYKEFTVEPDRQARAARMAVDLRAGLGENERDLLDQLAAWPQALVENDSGHVCGQLMPLLPPGFFTRLIGPDPGTRGRQPRDLAWLTAGLAQRQAAGVDVPDVELTDRLVLLAQLCWVVAWLHRRDWVYGDLNLRNVAFSLAPLQIKLIDCDGAAPLRDTRRRQGHQAGWEPPECQSSGGPAILQDTLTDVYKLGLAALRCLTPGKHASTRTSTRRLSGVLDPAGFDLIKRALSDQASRPSASELYRYFHQTVQTRMAPPQVLSIDLPGRVWPRGQDIRINWQVTGASEAVITTGNADREHADPSLHVTGYTIRPATSGPLTVEFRNRFAAVTVKLGQLRLFDVPPFTPTGDLLPRPVLPPLPSLNVRKISRNSPRQSHFPLPGGPARDGDPPSTILAGAGNRTGSSGVNG